MYTEHFGLKAEPFDNSYNSQFFFDHGDHARILRQIKDSLKANPGLTVITGATGSGKTTLSQKIISDFIKEIEIIWLAEPPKYGKELFLLIARELGLKQEASERVFVINDIKDAILNSEGSKCLLIIDESHLMADGTLSSITILNNLQEGRTKLIHVLLFGSEELLERISRPDMKPFKQRVTVLEHIGEMSRGDIRRYIQHRIKAAGGNPSIISDAGWEALILASSTGGSVPSVIDLLCHKSLSIAFEKNKEKVDIDDVCKAADGMGIAREVYRYMVTHRTTEGRRNAPSRTDKQPLHESIISRKGPESSSDIKSEDVRKNKSGAPDMCQEEPEEKSSTERNKKGFRNHCKAFLNKVLRKEESAPEEKLEAKAFPAEGEISDAYENMPEEKIEDVIEVFPVEAEVEVSDEMELAESHGNEPEEKIENASKASPVEMIKDAGSEIKNYDVEEELNTGENDAASEWVTTDTKGTKSFSLTDDNREKKSFSLDSKPAGQDAGNQEELNAPDMKKIQDCDQDTDSSSEWSSIDRKGIKPFIPSHTRENKKKIKEVIAEDNVGWVTAAADRRPEIKGSGIRETALKKKEESSISTEWTRINITNRISTKPDKAEEHSKSETGETVKKKAEKKPAKRKTIKKKAVKKKTEKKKAAVNLGK